MPIPENPSFQNLLNSISRTDPRNPEYQNVQVVKNINAKHADGRMYSIKGAELWYSSNSDISIDAAIRRICIELSAMKHPADERIALAILLLLTFHPAQKQYGVASLNEILALRTSATISQFHIMGIAENGINPVFFGDFSFDLVDPRRLAYKSEKAGSDYYELYGERLTKRVWLERKKFPSVILNWLAFQKRVSQGYQREYVDAVLSYFEAVSATLFDDFWFEFGRQQDLHISLGQEIMQERYFREIIGSDSICIFLDIQVDGKNRGYLVPVQVGRFEMSIPSDMGKRLMNLHTAIEKNYWYPGNSKGEIVETIKTFIKFIAKGYRYLAENKTDDGFLHFVIALDLLFGDQHESTKTVSNRCALLTYDKCNRSYEDQKKLLGKIYDLRSRYVHGGVSVQAEYVAQIQPICHEVIYCLLRIHRNNVGKSDPLTIELWKKKLDFAWAALEAKEPLLEQFKIEIGLDIHAPAS